MNFIRKSFGVLTFLISSFFVFMYTQTFGGVDIPAKFVDSLTDKVFYGLLMLGCASLMALIGTMLVSKVDLMENKPKVFLILFAITFLSFLGGGDGLVARVNLIV